MPKKKSIRKSADKFKQEIDEVLTFLEATSKGQTKRHVSWLYDYGIIRLYGAFEEFMLECLIGAINNDTSVLSERTGYKFPKHLTDEVCRYLIIGDGYFDFHGRDGLIKTLKKYVPSSHYLVKKIKDDKYKDTLNQLSALRNFAAHRSEKSKNAALKAIGGKRISTSGAWLKGNNRFSSIAKKLKELADEIGDSAPY